MFPEAALNRIDWDFPRSGTDASSVHALHWFPGNFIPQIPSFLIQILSEPGSVILDPFCGSGTTAVEALRLGRRAICGDRVSACIFLSAAKIAAAVHPLGHSERNDLLARFTWDHLCETEQVGRYGEGSDPRLAHWYSKRTLDQLRYIWKVLEEYRNPCRLSLELCFSDLLFSCASTVRSRTATGGLRRHHWGWIADNVRPKSLVDHNAVDSFRNRLMALPQEALSIVDPPVIIQNDARRLPLADGFVDVVVTSPPYIGVIDYVRANRMLYLWKGWLLDEEKAEEIGARYKRGRKDVEEQYIREMRDCWDELNRVLRPGGYCAIVIGDSRAFPGVAQRAMEQLGERLAPAWGPVRRTPIRRRVSDRSAQASSEALYVFQKK